VLAAAAAVVLEFVLPLVTKDATDGRSHAIATSLILKMERWGRLSLSGWDADERRTVPAAAV